MYNKQRGHLIYRMICMLDRRHADRCEGRREEVSTRSSWLVSSREEKEHTVPLAVRTRLFGGERGTNTGTGNPA